MQLHKIYNRLIFLTALFLCLLSLFSVEQAQAQRYPVQTNVYLVPPAGRYLSDYYSTTKEKIVVQLLNRDMLQPVLEVRLRMTITAVNGLRIQNREEINYPSILLDAGIPARLTQEDLLPYLLPQNQLVSGRLDKGKLPDGMIEFTFQAIEKYTGKDLSAPATARCWLTAQKPPLLNLPSNDEYIAYREPLQMLFQWMPQHRAISQVEYEFELRELPDFGAAPQSSFLYSPVIWQERVLPTTLIYDVTKMPLDPDKLYGWRVRAVAKDGVDEVNLFENDGYSEIRWFRTKTNCQPPANITASLDGRTLNLTWLPNEHSNEYVTQIRNISRTYEWTEARTYEPRAAFYRLERGDKYEYRVGAVCTAGQPVFSDLQSLTVAATDSAQMARCGMAPEIDLSNKEPLPELRVGEVVMCADFPMTVTKVSGSNGNFTGEGWVPVKWIFDQKWAVEFTNITVNTGHRLTGGVIKGKYDKNEGNLAQLDAFTEGGATNTRNGIVMPDITVDFTVPENPVFEYNAGTGEMVVYTAGGQEAGTIQIPQNEGKEVFPMVIKDSAGNLYQVEEETVAASETETGAGSNSGTPGKTKELKVTPIGSQSDPLPSNFDPKNISTSLAVITFENSKESKFAFDNYKDYYKTVNVIENNNIYDHIHANQYNNGRYDVGWKLVPVGETDIVTAKLQDIKDKNFDPKKVIFSTAQGTEYKSAYKNNTYAITIPSSEDNNVQEIYAVYKPDKSDCKNLGKLNVISYKKQQPKVTVVFVNSYEINTNTLKTELDKIYKPVGVDWQVGSDKLDNFSAPQSFFDKNSGLLENYNDNMDALIAAYKSAKSSNFDKNSCYVFILNDSGDGANRDAQGYMPRGRQFGFIFKANIADNKIYNVIAHELGHGQWKLKHTFDKSYGKTAESTKLTTDNLMDYSDNAAHIAKWQWDVMSQPAIFNGLLDKDEEGMIIQNAYYWTPSGHIIYLDNPQKGITNINDINFPDGALYGFIDNKINYTAKIENNLFYGYQSKDGTLYKDITTTKLDLEKVTTLSVISRIYNGDCTISEYKNQVNKTDIALLPDCSTGLPVNSNKYFKMKTGSGTVLKIEGCAINLSDLNQTGQDIYNANKVWIPDSDYDILLNIAALAQNLSTGLYNSFIFKQENDGSLFWNYKNRPTEYSREKLQNTLAQFKKYESAIEKLNSGKFAGCDELINHIKANFQITKGSNNPFVFPSDMKMTQIIIAPFKELSLERKKQLTDILHQCEYDKIQLVGDDVDAGTVLAILFKTSNEKNNSAESKALIDYIADKKYLKHFVNDLYSVQYEGFMNALLNMIVQNYKNDYANYSIGNPENNINYIEFSPAYFQKNAEKILDDGNVSLQVKHWFTSNETPVVAKPYAPVAVKFVEDVNFGTNITFKKGQTAVLPMIWAYQLFWKDTEAARWKTAQIATDVILTAVGVGEITAAIKLYRGARTAYATYKTIKALGDVGIGLTDVYIQNSNALTEVQLAKWNKFVLVYSVGSLGTSAVEGIALKLGKKTVDTADDFVKIEKEVEEQTEEAYKKLSKAERDEIDELINFAGADGLLEVADNIRYINGWTKESILAEVARRKTAGLAPLNPNEYLSADYIAKHLEQFESGASYLVPKDILDKYGRDLLGWTDNNQFIMPKAQMDELLKKTNMDLDKICNELGIKPSDWKNRELVRIDIPNPKELNIRMPNGNELGANDNWLPSGKLPTGYSEAIVNNIPKGKYVEINLK